MLLAHSTLNAQCIGCWMLRTCTGFRDGKIPLSMVITQCGGQQKFKLTVIEEVCTVVLVEGDTASTSGHGCGGW